MIKVQDYTYFSNGYSFEECINYMLDIADNLWPDMERSGGAQLFNIVELNDGKVRFHPLTQSFGFLFEDKDQSTQFWRWLYFKTDEEVVIFDMKHDPENPGTAFQEMCLFDIGNRDQTYREFKYLDVQTYMRKSKDAMKLGIVCSRLLSEALLVESIYIDFPMVNYIPQVCKSVGNKVLLRVLTKVLCGTQIDDFHVKLPEPYIKAVDLIMTQADKTLTDFIKSLLDKENKETPSLVEFAVYKDFIKYLVCGVAIYAENKTSIILAHAKLDAEDVDRIISEIDTGGIMHIEYPKDQSGKPRIVKDWAPFANKATEGIA